MVWGGLDKCYVTLKNAIETQKKCKKTRNKRVNTSECYETDKEGGVQGICYETFYRVGVGGVQTVLYLAVRNS